MKTRILPTSRLSVALASALAALLSAPSAHAVNNSWAANAAGNWADAASWTGGVNVPGSTTADNGDIATFSFLLAASGKAVTVDTTRFIGGITFGAGNTSAFGYTLQTGTLRLNSGSVIQTTGAIGANTTTISSPIVISGTTGATAAITSGATTVANGIISISGAVSGSAAASNTTTLTLNGTGTGANTISGAIGDGSGGGKLAVVKAGAGTWTLSGSNTFTGGISIDAGTLVAAADANLGGAGGGITLNGSATLVTAAASYARSLTLNNGAIATFGNVNPTFTGNVTGTGGLAMNTGFGAQPAFSGTGNTFEGPVTIGSSGTTGQAYRFQFSSFADSATANGRIKFSASAVTHPDGSVFQYNGATNLVLANRQIEIASTAATPTNGHQIRSSGTGTLSISTNLIVTSTANAQTLNLTGTNTGANTFGGVIANGSGSGVINLTKTNTGTWILAGANTYTGTTTVSAGTLELSNGAAIADTGAVSLTNAAGVVLKLNSSETIGSLSGGGTTGGVVNLQGNLLTVGSGSFSGVIQGTSGALTKTGAGTLTLAGANTYTGATGVSGGVLTVSGTGSLAGTSGLSLSGGAVFNYLPTTVGTTLTLGAASTLNLADGSALGLAWNSTTANKITALGAATIGTGAGVGLNMTGTFTSGTPYIILTATSGLDIGAYTVLNATNYTVAVTKLSGSVSITPTTAAALSGAYWTGTATTGLTKVWAASDGGADSNWAGSADGAAQALVPGSGADVIISANTVNVAPTATTLGANMTIKTLTIADTINGLGLDADLYTLTITPLAATAGITMNPSVPASTIAAKVALGANQTWTNDSANTLTVSGAVSGAFVLTKAGTGTLALTGVNTYSGGTTLNDNSGTLDISGAGSLGSGAYAGAIAIGTGSTLKFSSSVSASGQTLSGAITGPGGLTLAPSVNNATLTLSNAGNNFSGVTTISAGRIAAGPTNLSANTSFAIAGNATSGGQLFLNATGAVNHNLSIAGVGYVEADALSTKAGAIRLFNNNTFGGTMTLSGDARVGFIAGTSSATISGQITGGNGIEFYGATNTASITHTFTLSNIGATTANDYSGHTTITAANFSSARTGGVAVLSLGASDQIPNGPGKGNLVFTGADANHISVLELNAKNETLNGVSNVAAAGAIIRNTATGASVLTIGDADTSSSFSGVISDGGTGKTLALTKIGAGTLSLSGANTFVDATTITTGTLTLDNSLALQNSPLDTLNSIAGDPANGLKTTVTALQFGGLNGDKNLADVFTTSLGGYSGVTALTLRPGNGANSHVYAGVIADGAPGMTLTKSGAGAQTLSVGNSYTGATTIAAGGALVVAADGALGAAASGTTVAVNASLGLSGGITYTTTELVSGAGAGTAGTSGPVLSGTRGFIQSVSGSNTFAGNIELNVDVLCRIGTQDGAQLNLTGAITQATGITTASILFRTGNLNGNFVTLSGTGNSFGGDSTVFTGLATAGEYSGLRIGIDNAHPTNLTVQNFSSASGSSTALDLNGNDQALNGLASGGAGTLNIINLDTVNVSTLTLNPTADKNSGTNIVILGGSPGGTPLGVINLDKVGPFAQALSGANTYTGATSVSGGVLTVSGTGTLAGTSSLSVSGGAAFRYLPTTIATTLTLGAGSTLNLADGSAIGLGWDTATASQIAALGAATIGTGAGVGLNMIGTFTSGTQYSILTAASGLETGSYTVLNATDYAAVVTKTAGLVTITPTTTTALTGAYWKGGFTGFANVWAVSDGSANSNWVTTADGGATGLVPGSGADVVISANTVTVAPTATTLGANMAVKTLTIADTTSGLGLNPDGNTLTITPGATTGGITMNAGVPASVIGANVALGADQTWTNNSAAPLTVSGSASGAFALTKAGTGTVVLSGINTYSGATTVAVGTLQISGTGKLGNGSYAQAISLSSGTTLRYSSAANQTLSGAITGLGSLTKDTGNGDLTLSGPNTYDGVTHVSAGRLMVSSAGALGATTVGTVVSSGATLGSLTTVAMATGEALSLNGTGSTGTNGALYVGGSKTLTWDGPITLAGNTLIHADGGSAFSLTSNATVNLGADTLTFDAGNGANSTFAGDISGSGGISKTLGTAVVLTLSGNNSFTGATTVSAGVLSLGSSTALGGNNPGVNGTSGITLNTGATLRTTTNGTTVYAPIATSGNVMIGAPTTALGTQAWNEFIVTGAIGGSGNVTFNNTNNTNQIFTVTLGAANTYSGTTTIDNTAGTAGQTFVKLGVNDALPTTTVLNILGQAGTGTGRGIGLNLFGFSQTLAGLTNTAANLRVQEIVNSDASAAATLTINGSTNTTYSGSLGRNSAGFSVNIAAIPGSTNGNNFGLTKNGSGTFALTGSNPYYGATKILGGILSLGNTNAMYQSPLDTLISVTGDATNGLHTTVPTLTMGGLTGNKNLASVFETTAGSYNTVTALTLNPVTGATPSYSGSIADGATAMTLTKTGVGTQTLTGVNTYTGATTVNSGTLLVNSPGSLAAASAVAVNGTGTLGGSGTVGGGVTVAAAGSLAPGASVGTLTVNGALDISAQAGGTGKLVFELATLAASDKIVAGTLAIGSGVLGFGDFAFTNLGGLQVGTYKLITSGGLTGTLDSANLTGMIGGFKGTLQLTGNDVELVVSSAYASWATLKGLDDSDAAHSSAKNADPDSDGVNNLAEFAFNGDPLSGSNNGLRAMLLQDTGAPTGNELTYIVAVRDGVTFTSSALSQANTTPVDGLFYTVDGSLDLVFPGSAVSHVGAASDTAPVATGLPDLTGTAWEYHTFRLDASEGMTGKGFLRAKVSE